MSAEEKETLRRLVANPSDKELRCKLILQLARSISEMPGVDPWAAISVSDEQLDQLIEAAREGGL